MYVIGLPCQFSLLFGLLVVHRLPRMANSNALSYWRQLGRERLVGYAGPVLESVCTVCLQLEQ